MPGAHRRVEANRAAPGETSTDTGRAARASGATRAHKAHRRSKPVRLPDYRSRWHRAYRTRALVVDVLAAVAAFGLSLGFDAVPLEKSYAVASSVLLVAWLASLSLTGAYERRKFGVSDEEYRSVLRAFSGLVGAVAVLALLSSTTVHVRFLLVLVIALPGLTGLGRWGLRRWLRSKRSRGSLMMRTLVVGRADSAKALLHSVRAEPHQGMYIVAVCADDLDHVSRRTNELEGVPIIGSPEETLKAAQIVQADAVALAADPDLSGAALRRLTWGLAESNIELIIAPGLLDVSGPRLMVRPSTNLSLLHIQPPSPSRRTELTKGLMDFFGSGLLLLLLSPVLLGAALAIALTSRGPVFFRQVRIGQHGVPFKIYKFRTMVVDAEKRMEQLRHLSDGNAVQFKMRSDPRITPVGRTLRKYSIDELPQLINVLIGNMSLVGPRPQTQKEVDLYEPDAMRRLNVRPGMTGLWQVSGRSDLSWEESVRLDLRYVDNLSSTLDVHILMRTFKAVFGGGGAY